MHSQQLTKNRSPMKIRGIRVHKKEPMTTAIMFPSPVRPSLSAVGLGRYSNSHVLAPLRLKISEDWVRIPDVVGSLGRDPVDCDQSKSTSTKTAQSHII